MNDLRTAELKGKRVLYRPDYNVPLKGGVIKDDFRIQATVPTIEYLMEHGAKIIIVSHLGRPEGHEMEEFSLRPVAERLADLFPEHTVQMAHQIDHDDVHKAIEGMQEGDILVLPNVRFFPQEEENNDTFGHMLASLADLYVNDAFAVDHRAHASLVIPEKYIPSYPGFLLEKELEMLGKLTEKPEHPFVIIMGGAKVSDKIDVMEKLGKMADHILIGGAMANTFLLAKGEEISESKAEKDAIHEAEKLMEMFGDKLVLAKDYAKKENGDTFSYLDIGPGAIEQFKEFLAPAKMIFWNGSLGYTEEEEYAKGSKAIAEYIGAMKGVTSIVAGGDTVEEITRLKLHDHFTFVSTGGGAALELLAGTKLPAVVALEEAKN
ncbi:MAG TPA: phosphoglycerate kinase [Verrucomicrobiae bacterium]|nr:phosphoglycerate kinase [Verrucomicrobiae bacterium]